MNILFLYNETINPKVGGVEKITFLLANYLETKGVKVYFLGLMNKYPTQDSRQYFLPDPNSFNTKQNIDFYINFIQKNDIKYVINQGGTNPGISKLAFNSTFGGARLLTAIHNSPLANIINFSESHRSQFSKKGLSFLLPIIQLNFVRKLVMNLYRLKYSNHYKSICFNSHYVILLSLLYKQELSFFTGKLILNNVIGIHNPIQINEDLIEDKRKELLYVGRINTSQKRVDLLLKIWAKLFYKFPDWTLKVVGGGDELDYIKEMSSNLQLKNIFFYGFQNPQEFYGSASIFCMTSSFEGLPMTLLEAMQKGVVPIAFSSFLSVSEIINDGINGFLVEPFNIEQYVEILEKLMLDEKLINTTSIAARQKVKLFDFDLIGQKWIDIFNDKNVIN